MITAAMMTHATVTTTPTAICEPLLRPELCVVATRPLDVSDIAIDDSIVIIVLLFAVEVLLIVGLVAAFVLVGLLVVAFVVALLVGLVALVVFIVAVDCNVVVVDVIGVTVVVGLSDGAFVEYVVELDDVSDVFAAAAAGVVVNGDATVVVFCGFVSFVAVLLVPGIITESFVMVLAVGVGDTAASVVGSYVMLVTPTMTNHVQ